MSKTDTGTGTDIMDSGTGAIIAKNKGGRPKGSKSGYTQTAKGMQGHRKYQGIIPFETTEEINYNSLVIKHSLECFEISRDADINRPETLAECFRKYLIICEKNGMKIGTIGACTAMGISYKVLESWRLGYKRANNPEYKSLADMVCGICSMSREQLISDGKLHPVIGIFWQRNFDGLRNDTEQLQQTETADNENMTAEEYRQKYGQLAED